MTLIRALYLGLPCFLGLTVLAAPPLAAQGTSAELGQGLLSAAREMPVPPGWSRQMQGDAITFVNSGADTGAGSNAHMVAYRPVPVHDKIRSSLMLVGLRSTDPRANVGAVLASADGYCLVLIYPDKFAELTCSANNETRALGGLPNVAKLDGQDRIQVIDEGGVTLFTVNRQELGRIENHPAQGGDFGFAAAGVGEFSLNMFSAAHLTDEELRGPPAGAPQQQPQPPQPQQPPQSGSQPGSQAPRPVDNAPDRGPVPVTIAPRAGWSDRDVPGGIVTVNLDLQGDERSFPLELAPMGDGQRLTEVDVAIAPAGTGPQSLRAAAGLVWENPQQGQSCGLQITAAGDALLLCYGPDGRGIEVGRKKGAAQGPGPHRLSVFEERDQLIAQINGEEVGTLKSHPSIGGDMALLAWDRGEFGFWVLNARVAPRPGGAAPGSSGGAAPPPTPAEPRATTSMGADLSGPLPQFEGDQARAMAAYIGVTKSILMHEIGHALIGELGVPSTGPEEDAVDIYSALHLAEATVQTSGRPERDQIASEAASYAALLWYYSGKLDEQTQPAQSSGWQDEHTGGLKRFRNMFCVIYGANPRQFSGLAQAVKFEERTLARCEDEFLKQNRAWRAILSPYTRLSETMPEGGLPSDAPGAEVVVELQPSRRQIGEYLRRTHGEDLIASAEAIGRQYALPRPLKVVFQDCDTVNAWYAPREGQVTMCYNIVEHFIAMISDIETGTKGGFSAQELQLAAAAPAPGQNPYTSAAASGSAAPAQGGAARPIAAPTPAVAELQDFGIPVSSRLFGPPFRGATPTSNPKARLLTTPEVKALIERDLDLIVIDIRRGEGLASLPMAYQLTGAGRDGSLEDAFQLRLAAALQDLSEGQATRPLLVLGEDLEDRAAWNAALRIGQAGYPTYWYRGGIAAWTAAGLPLQPLN